MSDVFPFIVEIVMFVVDAAVPPVVRYVPDKSGISCVASVRNVGALFGPETGPART